ncbi:MAG TPA: glycosyltransferase family 2 protein [Candidatus Bathyarchaeia archaeon]|nr:glycosyltransferase family 2 protein [Candidatus Bathyarchaeia archaeon]
MNNVLVCPIAFNEHQKLKNAIERFLRTSFYGKVDYLVMDDGSTDGTTEMIRSFSDRGVKTLKHPQRRGVGAAIRSAIDYARSQGYEIIVIMAGNDKDEPNEIGLLVDPILNGQADFVQGSRYLKGRRTGGDMPFYRKIATRMHPFLLSFFVRRRVTDSTNGFRAIRLSILADERINLNQDWLDAYELEPYLLFKCIQAGYRFVEAPVTKIYPSRQLGYTKMKPVTGWWSILRPVIFLGLGLKQ